MAQNSQETKSKNKGRRTQVTELPKQEKELTKEEQKKVKGGGGSEGTGWPAFGKPQQ